MNFDMAVIIQIQIENMYYTYFGNSNATSLNYVGDNVMLVIQYDSYNMSHII